MAKRFQAARLMFSRLCLLISISLTTSRDEDFSESPSHLANDELYNGEQDSLASAVTSAEVASAVAEAAVITVKMTEISCLL